MPDIQWNLNTWDKYSWPDCGDEWSKCWGSSQAQFYGSILPRIARWLPAASILEIAPGFGRWTRFLLKSCQSYSGVDLSQKCTDACAKKFADHPDCSFFTNDGMSLACIPERSIDFIFSYDSLVHAEMDVINAYIPQLVQKLKPEGAAFIHHSNAANVAEEMKEEAKPHARALTVSSNAVKELLEINGGHVLLQEEVNWGSSSLIDCHTTFCRKTASFAKSSLLIQNKEFMKELQISHDYLNPYWF